MRRKYPEMGPIFEGAERCRCCAQQTDMHIRCESTAYSVGNVYEEKEYLYTSDVRSVLLATSYLGSLATFRCFTADHPARPVNDVQLVTSC